MTNVDNLRILIIGNDKGMRDFLKSALKQLGVKHIRSGKREKSR